MTGVLLSVSPPVIVIAGMGPQLGIACAKRFGRAGYRVAMIGRQADRLARYVNDLAIEGIESICTPADVMDSDAINLAMEKITIEFGVPNVVVYNAYHPSSGRATTLDMASARKTVDTATVGALNLVSAAMGVMLGRGAGTLVFTGNRLAVQPLPQDIAQSMATAAQRSLALGLAGDHERDGMHIATVTIGGPIKAGTAFDPAKIADVIWQLHNEPAGSWTKEWIFNGAPQF
jgi:NADP-dependent 3-hydroxy acid dehydrogenase YdfG